MAAIEFGAINYVATAVSAVVLMALGFAWYAPFLFGKAWMAALGKTEEEMRAAGPSPALFAALADAILTSLVLAIVFQAAGISPGSAPESSRRWSWRSLSRARRSSPTVRSRDGRGRWC